MMNNSGTNDYWGKHFIINLGDCNLPAVRNPATIRQFCKELVEAIDMVPYGEPQLIHFGKKDPKTAGWTLLQFIETSNIMAHFCDSGSAYIDVFSCKNFDPKVVTKLTEKYFQPKKKTSLFIARNPERNNILPINS